MLFVEDWIVIRRRVRINDGIVEQETLVRSTLKDADVMLGTLERSKWAVGHNAWAYDPTLEPKVTMEEATDE